MLSNTGNVSFGLYIFFIVIAFASTAVMYKFLKNGTLENEKLDKLIDFFKTVVFTTALGTIALLVTDLFKERDQDMKELEYFDKYVQEVKEVNGQGRLQLSRYLSIVAPNGEMKKSWSNYYEIVKKEYDEYLIAQEKLKMDTAQFLTNEETIERKINQEKVESFEMPLNSNFQSEWYIVAGGDSNMEEAKYELDKALKINVNSQIMKKGNSYRTVLVGYKTKADAESQLEEVKQSMNNTAYIVNKTYW